MSTAPATALVPREGMMAVVRNRRALVTAVQPFDADEDGRLHVVEVEYSDGIGAESEELLWEVEPGAEVLEPAALPDIARTAPMEPREFAAMIRAARWSALTPSLPFSGLVEDRPPLAAPLFGAVHPEAYQLVPVLRALEMPRVALMLADAVGLGKTIQAGMILRELMLRRRIRRVLVICPAALRTQWRDEMDEKFALPFEIVDRPQTQKLQRELGLDANPWRIHERVIASYHYLKQPDVLEQFRTTAEPGEDGRLRWDLLVVDEAHNLSPASFGQDSDLAQMLQAISPWFEHRIFLTATPHNGHTRSFSGLLEALDPVRFTRKSELDGEDRARVAQSVIRRLKSEINRAYTSLGDAPRFSERVVQSLPTLRFGAAERALAESFHDFRKAVIRQAARSSGADKAAATFATEVLQKRLLSGPWAFGQSWRALTDGLAMGAGTADAVTRLRGLYLDDTDNDAERESRQRLTERTVGAWLQPFQGQVSSEIAAVTEGVDALSIERIEPGLDPTAHHMAVALAADKVKADARWRCLETLITERLRRGDKWLPGDQTGERLVIFTEYLATLDYITARLRQHYGDGPFLLTLFGGMNDAERDAVKRAFNDPASTARILVATDAAGEGLNLQRSCRMMVHWDIPWNPGKMEQRNGRLDRHGQERDVEVYHFDSTDDASMRFLGKVLKKRSQTREDRVVTDDIFARALLQHFEYDEDPDAAERRLDDAIANAKALNRNLVDDLPDAESLPGQSDHLRLEALRRDLDLSPQSLRETLETALAIDKGRPRLSPDGKGRDRLTSPVPEQWRELVDQTLRDGGLTGPMCTVVFDPAQFVVRRSGRPVFLPEPDARLLHLGHALYHRVMATFARYRFPGGPVAATRWAVRTEPLPVGVDARILLTLEELAVNELREPCHHWVRTVAMDVRAGELGPARPVEPADHELNATLPDAEAIELARREWDEVDRDLKRWVEQSQRELTAAIAARLQAASKVVADREKLRFAQRQKELEKAISDNQIAKLEREIAAIEQQRQQYLFTELSDEERRRLSDKQAELALRRHHYDAVVARLLVEKARTLQQVLPKRYKLRGEARVYPIAIEVVVATLPSIAEAA